MRHSFAITYLSDCTDEFEEIQEMEKIQAAVGSVLMSLGVHFCVVPEDLMCDTLRSKAENKPLMEHRS